MIFSYLDPPNWQQQHNHGSGSENPELTSLPAPSHVGAGLIRPGSMADRARLEKIPQPEAGLKCPRCESTNTKFCYFNNYSLTQPRHFCKNCRRYWTRGGALRTVPVGGGCRRNKKTKSITSKSAASSTEKQDGGSSSTNAAINHSEITAHHLPQQTSHFPFMASSQSFPQFGLGNLVGAQADTAEMGFHIGPNSGMNQHQLFPFFDPNNGLYCHEGMEGSSSMMGESQLLRSSSRVSQLTPVKSENNNQLGLNLSRSMMGVSENNQFWGGNNWTDLSGLNASNTNHLL